MAIGPNQGKSPEKIAEEFETKIDDQIRLKNKKYLPKGSSIIIDVHPFPPREIINILRPRYQQKGWGNLDVTTGFGRDDSSYLRLTY